MIPNVRKSMQRIICFLIMVLSYGSLFAQDYLVTTLGDTIVGEVQHAGADMIIYLTSDTIVKEVSKKEISGYMKQGLWVDGSYTEVDTSATKVDILAVNLAKSQKAINLAGLRLEQSRTMFYIGIACQIVGGSIMALSQLPKNNNPKASLYIGGSVAGIGNIVMLSAFIPIGSAGIELQKVRFN